MKKNFVGAEGFEPSLTEPKSVVTTITPSSYVLEEKPRLFSQTSESYLTKILKMKNTCNTQAEEEGFEPPCPLGQPR